MTSDAKLWIRGIIAAVIGGGATAGGSWMAINAVAATGAAITPLNWKALGIILVVGALTSVFAYLQKSPVPNKVEQTVTTVTKETTKEGV